MSRDSGAVRIFLYNWPIYVGTWAVALGLLVCLVALASGTLCLVAWAGALEVWHLAMLSFVNGCAWATDNPVRRVLMGEAVGRERMAWAMSLDVGAANVSRAVGPAAGGILLAHVGIAGAFLLSVLLYATALLATLGVRTRIARGEWRRESNDVLVVAGTPDTWLRRAMVVTLGHGGGLVLGHRAAAHLQRFDGFRDPPPIEVVSRSTHVLGVAKGVRLHRTGVLSDRDVTRVRAIPTTNAAATPRAPPGSSGSLGRPAGRRRRGRVTIKAATPGWRDCARSGLRVAGSSRTP